MCEVLANLHAAVPAHAWEHTEQVLTSAFRVSSVDEIFEEFDKVPLGSGSIAQVPKP